MEYIRDKATELRELVGFEQGDLFTKEVFCVLSNTIKSVYDIETELYSQSLKEFDMGYMTKLFGERGTAIACGKIKVVLINDMINDFDFIVFTYLHKIGHFLLGHMDNNCNDKSFWEKNNCKYEMAADEFAREFLRG